MELTVLLCCCCFQLVVTDVLICSDYLVSGSHGVEDTALSESSYLVHDHACDAKQARLYDPGDLLAQPPTFGGWLVAAHLANPYIQVTFAVDTIVTAVTVQGRAKQFQQWVKSYHLQYSMDNITWTTVTSSDGSPKLFIGSHDTNTPVTAMVEPKITVRHLRINPQTWEWFIAMRFGVSGCLIMEDKGGSSRVFSRKNVKPTEEMFSSYAVFTNLATAISVKDFGLSCYRHKACVSFIIQTAYGIKSCAGYNAWIFAPGRFTPGIEAFVNQDFLDIYGYKEDEDAGILYNIIEVRKNKENASNTCVAQYTRLMRVDTASKLAGVKKIIERNNVLKQDYRFYVSGIYSSGIWRYDGGNDLVNDSLWSLGNSDPSQGHCVMLTQAGLASVDCQENLYSICGN